MKSFSKKFSRTNRRHIGLLFILSVLGCIFLILAVITNTHWVPVYIPSLPWHALPVIFAFETPLIVALAISFLLGCLVTFVVWRAIYGQAMQKQGALRHHVSTLENTLEKTQRLISTTSQNNQPPNSSNQQE